MTTLGGMMQTMRWTPTVRFASVGLGALTVLLLAGLGFWHC